MITRTKKFMAAIATILAASSFIAVRHLKKQCTKAQFTIGIIQTASHPALDAVREGFMEEAHKLFGNKAEFVIKNAQGSIPSAHTIAEQFHNDKNIHAIMAIATPAAQAISSIEKEKTILIAAVTDPKALGLDQTQHNITGVSDMIDVKATAHMISQLLPNAKTIGFLFSNGENNSITLVKLMRAALTEHGLTTIDFAVSSESEMPMAAESAFSKTDAVFAPTDNNVASTIEMISQLSQKYHKPFIASDNLLVKKGALAARGIDYKESGKQAARIAYAILHEGKKTDELPIINQKESKIFINKKMLDLLGLPIPENLHNNITIVD